MISTAKYLKKQNIVLLHIASQKVWMKSRRQGISCLYLTVILDKWHYHLMCWSLLTDDTSALSLLIFSGLMIESSSVMLVDPDHIRENTADQSVRVDITLILAQNSADFVLAQNLWQSIRIYTADADGNQRGSANTLAILTTEQSRTCKCIKVGSDLIATKWIFWLTPEYLTGNCIFQSCVNY